MTPGGPVWRAVHVHRQTEQDRFLIEGLAPTLDGLRSSGELHGAFFLRYWLGGPHVRVRLRLDRDRADAVAAEVAHRFRGVLARTPVQVPLDAEEFHRDAQPTLAALEGETADVVHPPDTVRPETYRPELDKYGGPPGVAIAERFFDISSAVVLAALPDIDGESPRRLGAGFSAMVHGLHATGTDPGSMAEFFGHYCLLWSPYVFDQFLDAWPELLAARRTALLAHTERVLARPDPAGDPFAAAVRDAEAAARSDPAVLPGVTLLGEQAPQEHRHRALLVAYLHTHNNRLGISPELEAFLGFLGHHVLSTAAGRAPSADLLPALRRRRAERLATTT